MRVIFGEIGRRLSPRSRDRKTFSPAAVKMLGELWGDRTIGVFQLKRCARRWSRTGAMWRARRCGGCRGSPAVLDLIIDDVGVIGVDEAVEAVAPADAASPR